MISIEISIFISDDLVYAVEKYDQSPGISFKKTEKHACTMRSARPYFMEIGGKRRIKQIIQNNILVRLRNCIVADIKNWTESNLWYDIAKGKLRQLENTEKLLLEWTDCK
jgi:hypothetical protein